MARCPNCEAVIEIDALKCDRCVALFDAKSDWRPLPATDRESMRLEQRKKAEFLAGKQSLVSGMTIALPKSGGIYLSPQSGSGGVGCFLVLFVIFYVLAVLVMLASELYLVAAIIVGLPLITLLVQWSGRSGDRGRKGIYLYPAEGYMVRRDWTKSTIQLGLPMRLSLRALSEAEQAVIRDARVPLSQRLTGTAPLYIQLVVGGPLRTELITAGTEEEMIALREEIERGMQWLREAANEPGPGA